MKGLSLNCKYAGGGESDMGNGLQSEDQPNILLKQEDGKVTA